MMYSSKTSCFSCGGVVKRLFNADLIAGWKQQELTEQIFSSGKALTLHQKVQ